MKEASSNIVEISKFTYLKGCSAQSRAHFEPGMSSLNKKYDEVLTSKKQNCALIIEVL